MASGLIGKLTLTLRKARDLKDVQTLGKQDPYCVLTIGKEQFKSQVVKNGGQNVEWEQSFLFNLTGVEDALHIKVNDQETLVDRPIGRCDISLQDLVTKAGKEGHWFQVADVNNFSVMAGQLYLKADFTGTGLVSSSTSQPTSTPTPTPTSAPTPTPTPAPAPAPTQQPQQQPQQQLQQQPYGAPLQQFQQPPPQYQQSSPTQGYGQPVYGQPGQTYYQPQGSAIQIPYGQQPVYGVPQGYPPQQVYVQQQPIYGAPLVQPVIYAQPVISNPIPYQGFVLSKDTLAPQTAHPLKQAHINPLIALRSYHGKFITAFDGSRGWKILAQAAKLDAYEEFEVVPRGGHKIALKSYHGKYLATDGQLRVIQSNTCGRDEEWIVEPKSSDEYFLRSSYGRFLCAQDDDTLVADRERAAEWEAFTIVTGTPHQGRAP